VRTFHSSNRATVQVIPGSPSDEATRSPGRRSKAATVRPDEESSQNQKEENVRVITRENARFWHRHFRPLRRATCSYDRRGLFPREISPAGLASFPHSHLRLRSGRWPPLFERVFSFRAESGCQRAGCLCVVITCCRGLFFLGGGVPTRSKTVSVAVCDRVCCAVLCVLFAPSFPSTR